MQVNSKYRIIFLFIFFPFLCWGQKDMQIDKLFKEYGKKSGSTMIELSKEMLKTYDMTLYKSITIKNDTEAIEKSQKYIAADKLNAKKIKEIVSKGLIVTGYYQLNNRKEYPGINRFILFKISRSGNITLIYIEGKLESEDLITMLFMRKD